MIIWHHILSAPYTEKFTNITTGTCYVESSHNLWPYLHQTYYLAYKETLMILSATKQMQRGKK